MNKNIFLGAFYCALGVVSAINPTNATEANLSPKTLLETMQVAPLEQQGYVRVTFPLFNGSFLSCQDVEKITKSLVSQYGDNVRIIFVLPNNIEEIEDEAFLLMGENLERLDILPQNNVKEINYRAFAECKNFDIHVIGDKIDEKGPFPHLDKIGKLAFANCKKLSILPFNENTPINVIGGGALSGSGFTCITLPRTTKYVDLEVYDPPIENLIIPKETNPDVLRTQNFREKIPLKIWLDPTSDALSILQILKKLIYGFFYRAFKDHPTIVLADQKKGTGGACEFDSVLLIQGKTFLGTQNTPKVPCCQLCFSHPQDMDKLAQATYDTYLKNDTSRDGNPLNFLQCLPPELILYAFSQESGAFLNRLKEQNEDMYSLFLRCFLYIRFFCDVSCYDLCIDCANDVDTSFIKECFIDVYREDTGGGNKKETSSDDVIDDFIDIFKKDDADTLMSLLSTDSQAHKSLLVRNLSNGITTDSLVHVGLYWDPGKLSLIDLAALYGAEQIFKYLYNGGYKKDISTSTLNGAFFGKNYEIIHLVEEKLEESEKSLSQKEARRILDRLPHPDIFDYVYIKYVENNMDS